MYTACQVLHKKLLYLLHFQHPQSPHLCSWGSDPIGAEQSGCHPGRRLRCSLNCPLLFAPCEFEVFASQGCSSDTQCTSLWSATCTQVMCTPLSLTGTHSSPSPQSTKQNTELSVHKHPREEEPHVADATALLNASFKAFWGLYCRDE